MRRLAGVTTVPGDEMRPRSPPGMGHLRTMPPPPHGGIVASRCRDGTSLRSSWDKDCPPSPRSPALTMPPPPPGRGYRRVRAWTRESPRPPDLRVRPPRAPGIRVSWSWCSVDLRRAPAALLRVEQPLDVFAPLDRGRLVRVVLHSCSSLAPASRAVSGIPAPPRRVASYRVRSHPASAEGHTCAPCVRLCTEKAGRSGDFVQVTVFLCSRRAACPGRSLRGKRPGRADGEQSTGSPNEPSVQPLDVRRVRP